MTMLCHASRVTGISSELGRSPTSGFCCGPKQLLAGQGAGRLSGLQRGLTSMWSRLSRVNVAFLNVPFASALRARRGGFTRRCATNKTNNLTSGFCCGPKQLLAGQGAGRLLGLQRGLTSMWSRLSRVNVAFLNVPFASALRARRGGFTSLQTKSVHFKLCLAGIVKQARITYSWFRD